MPTCCIRGLVCVVLLGVATGVVRADDAVVGNGHAAGCDEAAFDAALAQLYPGATFPGGTLTFDCGADPVTVVFTSEKGVGFGTGTVIDGGGRITLDGGNATRLFAVSGTQGRVELRGLVLERGFAVGSGGAVHVAADNALLVADSILRDSAATGAGGALYAQTGSGVVLERSTLIGNSALDGGGMMANGAVTASASLFANNDAIAGEGGGLVVYGGEVAVTDTRFENNDATDGGGVLLRAGSATFTDVRVEGNVAAARGGGIAVYGDQTLLLSRVQLTGNFADQGGGLHIGGTDDGAGSAETVRSNVVSAQDSRFDSNQAREGGGAFVFGVPPQHTGRVGALALADTLLVGNHAERGGAVHSQGYLDGSRVRVQGNTAADGGGLYLAPNLVGSPAGIARETGQTLLFGATLIGNEATRAGGGVYGHAALLLGTGLVVDGNYSAFGGGLAYADSTIVVVSSMSVVRNRATQAGGGLFVDSASAGAFVVDSTFSDNRVDPAGRGGQIHVTTDTGTDPAARTALDLISSTLYGGGEAAAGVSLYADVSSSITYIGSILGHPAGGGCGAGPASSVMSAGYNLQAGFSCDAGGVGDTVATTQADLRLAPLADNGGDMPTHLPRVGSPAIDHHPCLPVGITNSGSDQRRASREVDGDGDGLPWCDAGAIERQPVENEGLFDDGFESDETMD